MCECIGVPNAGRHAMRKMVVVAVLVAVATATTAWSMTGLLSKPSIINKADVRYGGGYGGGYGLPPTRLTPLW
jgi:hypothetical protein